MQTPPFDFITRKICAASAWFSTRDLVSTRSILTWIKLKLKEDIRTVSDKVDMSEGPDAHPLLRTSLTIRFLLQKDYH